MGASRTRDSHARKMRICRSFALLAQLVEHFHGKEGVDGSSPSEGSHETAANRRFHAFWSWTQAKGRGTPAEHGRLTGTPIARAGGSRPAWRAGLFQRVAVACGRARSAPRR